MLHSSTQLICVWTCQQRCHILCTKRSGHANTSGTYGMATCTIHVIFNAVVVAKLTYAASSWWGFTTAEDRQRLEAVIRRVIRSGLCAPDHMSLEDLVTDADNKRFNHILYSKYHVLHAILPGRSDSNYNLRPWRHNLVLTTKSCSLHY